MGHTVDFLDLRIYDPLDRARNLEAHFPESLSRFACRLGLNSDWLSLVCL
jgi:hypothetical protein